MKDFATPTERSTRTIEFAIDGEVFYFTPPKKAALFASANMTRDFLNWLGEGLSEEQGQRIFERLDDPDDVFDIDQVNEIAKYLMGQISGRPTKRR